MKRGPRFRRNRHAFSAFYGAFGVLLVSTAVIGGIIATMGAQAPSTDVDRRLAQQFLDALLASEAANGTTLNQALAGSCFSADCPASSWNASSLQAAINVLAGPLAKALERHYLISIVAANATQFSCGDAVAVRGGATASADVFRPQSSDFLGISLLLSAAL
jgi:hypothetical protein